MARVRERLEATVNETYVVRGDWLCEVVNHCTCAGVDQHGLSVHESGCGLEPIASIEQIQAALWQQAENNALIAGTPDGQF